MHIFDYTWSLQYFSYVIIFLYVIQSILLDALTLAVFLTSYYFSRIIISHTLLFLDKNCFTYTSSIAFFLIRYLVHPIGSRTLAVFLAKNCFTYTLLFLICHYLQHIIICYKPSSVQFKICTLAVFLTHCYFLRVTISTKKLIHLRVIVYHALLLLTYHYFSHIIISHMSLFLTYRYFC